MAKITQGTKQVARTLIEDVPVYTVELNEEQIVALGLLSYRHEAGAHHGPFRAFYSTLPSQVKQKVMDTSAAQPTGGVTKTTVDWGA